MRSTLFLAAVASLVAAAPSVADACSPPLCSPGFFSLENGTAVPANVPGFRWSPMSGPSPSPADPSKVVLARATAPGTPLPFTATRLSDGDYIIVPNQPLMPGTGYVLTDQNTCGGSALGPRVTFQAVDAAPLPTSLGALMETESHIDPLTVATGSGSCSSEVDAHQIGITLQLTPEALEWRGALQFETLVDGQVWKPSSSAPIETQPGTSWRGRGVDLLYRVCKTNDELVTEGLAAGPHEVVMRATLPGSGTVVQSSSLTVQFGCADTGSPDPGGEEDEPDGGCDAGGSGSSSWLLLGSLAALGGLRRRTARPSR